MKLTIFSVTTLIGLVLCDIDEIKETNNVIPIISFEDVKNQDGSYRFSFVTGNGIKVAEEGALRNVTVTSESGEKSTEEAMSAKGGYSYPSPGGGEVRVIWTADENGFHPKVTFKPRGSGVSESTKEELKTPANETKSA